MNCFHCGDCCLRMSPLDAPYPCRHLKQDGTFYFCAIYYAKPAECDRHDFPMRHCPIGVEKLNITSTTEMQVRLETGYIKAKEILNG